MTIAEEVLKAIWPESIPADQYGSVELILNAVTISKLRRREEQAEKETARLTVVPPPPKRGPGRPRKTA